MLVVVRLIDGENISLVNCNLVRFVPMRDGNIVDILDIKPGLVCRVWHFGDESFRLGAVDGVGVITEDCAVVSLFHADSECQQEVPFEYLRLSKPATQRDKHSAFMGEQQLKLDKGLPSNRLKDFMKNFIASTDTTKYAKYAKSASRAPKKAVKQKKEPIRTVSVDRVHSSLEPRRNKTVERLALHEPRMNRSLPVKEPSTNQSRDEPIVSPTVTALTKPLFDIDKDTGETIFCLCEALHRLKLNPLIIFNIANKPPKLKFISHEQFLDTVGSLTNIDISKSVKKVIVKVIDPNKSKKLDVKLLKTNMPALIDIGSAFSLVEPVSKPLQAVPSPVRDIAPPNEETVFSPRSLLKAERTVLYGSEWEHVDPVNIEEAKEVPLVIEEVSPVQLVEDESTVNTEKGWEVDEKEGNCVIDRAALGLKPHPTQHLASNLTSPQRQRERSTQHIEDHTTPAQTHTPVHYAPAPHTPVHQSPSKIYHIDDSLHEPYAIDSDEREGSNFAEERNCWLQLQWLLPSHTLLYLTDGVTAVEGYSVDTPTQDLSNLADNFVFRNKGNNC